MKGLEYDSRGFSASVSQVLDDVLKTVEDVAEGMKSIAQATDQQQTGGLISQNVDDIAALSEKNLSALVSITDATHSLKSLSNQLTEEMARFKT